MTPPIYDRVALIGLGLIASSMAHAMKQFGLVGEIVGYAKTEETRRVALEIGICDRVFGTAAEAVQGADLVVLAVPVGAMAEIAAERPVKALMCDSTNIFSHHAGRSEASIKEPIRELVSKASGMVVATTFASNVARLKTLAEAARAADRSVCLLGRAMRRMVAAAQESGVLTDFPPTVSPEGSSSLSMLATRLRWASHLIIPM
mgnify:CR=1 FL=1